VLHKSLVFYYLFFLLDNVFAITPAVPEDSVLLSLPFGGAVLEQVGVARPEIDAILEDVRRVHALELEEEQFDRKDKVPSPKEEAKFTTEENTTPNIHDDASSHSSTIHVDPWIEELSTTMAASSSSGVNVVSAIPLEAADQQRGIVDLPVLQAPLVRDSEES
jgi:hypothetical protein